MAATIKDLGKVTAYAYAKAAGYTGTEEQFQAIFNEFTENAPGLIDRMDTAVARAEAAVTNIDATIQDAVDDAVEEATASAVATANQAVTDAQAAQTAAEGAVTQANAAVTQANNAVTAAQAAQSAAEDAAESFVLDRTLTDSGAAAPADLVGNLKESLNSIVGIVNYRDADQDFAEVSGATNGTCIGIKSQGSTIIINGTNTKTYGDKVIRIQLSYGFYRANSASLLKSNISKLIPLIKGHRYCLEAKMNSGTVSDYTAYIFLRNSAHSDIAFVTIPEEPKNSSKRFFTWNDDNGGYLFLYSNIVGQVFTNYSFDLFLYDVETYEDIIAENNQHIIGSVDALENELNYSHNLINYGYDNPQSRNRNNSASDSNVLGYKREKQIITLDKEVDCVDDVYVRINNSIATTYLIGTVDSWTEADALELKAGAKYKLSLIHLSGTASRQIGISVYKTGTHNTIGFSRKNGNATERFFTAEENTKYNIAIWIASNTVLTDYKVLVILEEEAISPKYANEMETTIDSVVDLMTEPCLVFPMLTDIHYLSPDSDYPSQFVETAENINFFMRNVECNGVVCLGDITDGGYSNNFPSSISAGEVAISQIFESLSESNRPIYFAVGNHDDFRYVNRYMLPNEIYNYYMRWSDNDVVYDEESYGTNYYKDFPSMKTRLICFNTNVLPTSENKGAYGISNRTLAWMTSILNDMPNDYIGMIITHVSVYPEITSTAHPYNIDNAAAMRNVINSSGKLCFVLCGHSHFDISYKAQNDVLVVMEGCAKFEGETTADVTTVGGISGGVRYGRSLEDETSDLWDVVVLRPFSKKLDLVRFGAGVDRHFDLSL